MQGEHVFLLAVVVIVVVVTAIMQISKNRHRITRAILRRLNIDPELLQRKPREPGQASTAPGSQGLTEEERSKAELARLQEFIEDRKQVARDADVSYHLWGFYRSLFRNAASGSLEHYVQDGEWYDVNILRAGARDGRNEFEFELKGARYKFVDDEEKQGWRENIKFFSLFLYDDSGRCLIEIPMKMRVDKLGRNYSIMSEGPRAFLPGEWVNDFINVKLKHQSIRNQEIRAQKHQERLWEIKDLKDRFGLSD